MKCLHRWACEDIPASLANFKDLFWQKEKIFSWASNYSFFFILLSSLCFFSSWLLMDWTCTSARAFVLTALTCWTVLTKSVSEIDAHAAGWLTVNLKKITPASCLVLRKWCWLASEKKTFVFFDGQEAAHPGRRRHCYRHVLDSSSCSYSHTSSGIDNKKNLRLRKRETAENMYKQGESTRRKSESLTNSYVMLMIECNGKKKLLGWLKLQAKKHSSDCVLILLLQL